MSPTRRRFLEFLVAVAAVHVMAITLYYALDVAAAPPDRQRQFTWAWMGVTVAAVLLGLARIRRARRADRATRQ